MSGNSDPAEVAFDSLGEEQQQQEPQEQPQDLQCPLCLDTFTDPCYVCPNHHTLCRACYQGVVDSSPVASGARCPQCRERLSRPVENGHLRGLIEASRRHQVQLQLQQRQQQQQQPAWRPRQATCQHRHPDGCPRPAFSRCGHCRRDLCDLHFSEDRLAFQADCHRQLAAANAAARDAERREAAQAAWRRLLDACVDAIERRRDRLTGEAATATTPSGPSASPQTLLRAEADALREALHAGDLRSAAAAHQRLSTAITANCDGEGDAGEGETPRRRRTARAEPPSPELAAHLLGERLAGLLDGVERQFRDAMFGEGEGDGEESPLLVATSRRRLASVRASDLAVVELGGLEEVLWRGPSWGLRLRRRNRDEAEQHTSPPATPAELQWRPLPSPALYCKTPNSREVRVLDPRSGSHLATLALACAEPHLLERLIFSRARQLLLLSNGQSVMECDLTGGLKRRLSGFRGATGIALDERRTGAAGAVDRSTTARAASRPGRLFVLESLLGCVLVYTAESFAPLQTLGPFGPGLHSICYLPADEEAGCRGDEGRLLVTDSSAGCVRVFAGRQLVPLIGPQLKASYGTSATVPTVDADPEGPPTALAVDGSGRAFVATARGFVRRLQWSSPTTKPLLKPTAELAGRQTPSALAVLPAGGGGVHDDDDELLVCSSDAFGIDAFRLATSSSSSGSASGSGREQLEISLGSTCSSAAVADYREVDDDEAEA